MDVPRQEGTGRVNQKRRTRTAIVDAAERLLAQGVTPTVADAAEVAGVGRTTAYRYFPSQDALLVEVALNVHVADIEDLLERQDGTDPVERTLELVASFNRHVFGEEVRYRTALRFYLDQWLTAAGAGEEAPVVREGRRRRWFRTALGPLRGRVPDEELDRLAAALGLVCGVEAMVSLRDTAQLEGEEALAVATWAAEALLAAVIGRPR